MCKYTTAGKVYVFVCMCMCTYTPVQSGTQHDEHRVQCDVIMHDIWRFHFFPPGILVCCQLLDSMVIYLTFTFDFSESC